MKYLPSSSARLPLAKAASRLTLRGALFGLSGLGLALTGAPSAYAGEADVIAVGIDDQGSGRYTFSVTVKHADAGWEHYADAWQVLSLDGKTVYGERVLYHPHVNEQPFTRSLSGVAVPDGVSQVLVRARDSVHGFGGATMTVTLPGR